MPSVSDTKALQPAVDFFKRLTTVPKKEAKLTIGLDIGSSSVKALALGQHKGLGPRVIIGQHAVPLKEGQEADPSEAIKSAIESLSIPSRVVNLSVSGQWVVMRVVEMPAMKSTEIKQAIPFEAQRYLPFNISDVIIDGVILGPAEANHLWVLIAACKKELIERKTSWAKKAGLEVALVDVDAVALANSFLGRMDTASAKGTQAIINIGASMTNLVILRENTPYLVRDIPWGGDKLTRAIAEQLSSEPASISKELSSQSLRPELVNALKQSVEALVNELQLSFDYFENKFGQPPETLFITGGISQYNGFTEALKSCITQKVTAWTPAAGLSGQFAIAYGLALRTY